MELLAEFMADATGRTAIIDDGSGCPIQDQRVQIRLTPL